MSGEAASRAKLELPGRQGELAAAIIGTGRPVVVLLFSGRPICVPEVFAGAGAVLACWFPGTEAGNAVADILTGRVSPTARLAMTWPRHVGQVPLYFAELSGGRPEEKDNRYTSKYLDLPNSPEFPFGHGLGYTDFAFDNLSIELGSAIRVKFRARNLGPTPGETTVFIFVRDLVAPIARPLLALRRFLKIALSAFEEFHCHRRSDTFGSRYLGPRLQAKIRSRRVRSSDWPLRRSGQAHYSAVPTRWGFRPFRVVVPWSFQQNRSDELKIRR